jgi:hypothetical protein
MLVSFSLLKILAIAAQLVCRSMLLPVTEALDLEIWEACMYPGGYRQIP